MHQLLEIGTDFLRFAPIPGLQEVGRTLLGIWDALKMVDVSPLVPHVILAMRSDHTALCRSNALRPCA